MRKLFATIACIFSLGACAQNPEISVEQLSNALSSGSSDFVLIDVRTEPEYDAQHIEGAILIPLQIIETKLDEIADAYGDKKIYLICRSSRRSGIATKILTNVQLDAYNVVGGMNAWNRL